MTNNSLLMQYFEWYLPSDMQHWQRLINDVDHLESLGVSHVWLPPFCKATSINDVGYGIYDLWDLGEFDQKGNRSTKYGSKEDLLQAIKELKEVGIQPLADLVLNHKAHADGKEKFRVLKMNPANRQEPLSEPFEIEAWTYFNFPGRQQKYSDFEWHWYHFSGIDYDALNDQPGIFLILGDHKGWVDNHRVDQTYGNYDYLMFADIDYSHQEVKNEVFAWLKWLVNETGVTGFRLDALKHIDSEFIKELGYFIQNEIGQDLYLIGELWISDLDQNLSYLDAIDYKIDLYDVGLHMNFYQASQAGAAYDLSQIFKGSLVLDHPLMAVTFVNNHDTQRGQALESCVDDWFIQHAYALILLRQEGLPSLFYGDYYGVGQFGSDQGFRDQIDPLLNLRKDHAYGDQIDYFDHPNTIGWTRLGTEEHPYGIAVVISNSEAGYKDMTMGSLNQNKVFVDYLGNHPDQVQLDDHGNGLFPVQAGSVSVWIDQAAMK